jgi:hypothetical protein
MSLGNPIRLTRRTELPDGRVADVVIPFSLPEGMTLLARSARASVDSEGTLRAVDQPGTAPSRSLRPVQMAEDAL